MVATLAPPSYTDFMPKPSPSAAFTYHRFVHSKGRSFMTQRTTRRQFIQHTSLAGLGFWVAGGLTPAFSRSPNGKLQIAGIGIGGKGSNHNDQARQVRKLRPPPP